RAYALGSDLDAPSGAITFEARNASDIKAEIASASASVAVGGGGLGASIGVALARNFIGHERDGTPAPLAVHAYAEDTGISTGGDLRFTAEAEQTVDALI